MKNEIEKKAFDMAEELCEIRHCLHRIPELEFDVFETSEFIKSKLEEYGIPYKTVLKTGIIAEIKGENDGKTVLLRADIDALPILEESGVEFASEHKGLMHACGHDIHAACLLGAAKILHDMRSELCGTVKCVFQPAEEGDGGALPMIQAGIMENPHVDGAFALHVEPLEETGNIQIKDGSIMASPDDFEIVITGVGGHGAVPEKCVNPVTAGAMIIDAYKNITDEFENSCVVTICTFNSGSCRNVVPDTAVLTGTARSLDNKTRFALRDRLIELAEKTAEKIGAKAEFSFNQLFPPVVNNADMNKIVVKSAKKLCSVKKIVKLEKASMTGDDFSYFSELVPGAYFKLGVGNKEIGACYPIHSPKFKADERALPIGAAIMAQAAVEFLKR